MEKVNEIYIENFIKENIISILYFSGNTCEVCGIMKNKIQNIINNYPKVKFLEVNGYENLMIAAKYNVFSIPTLILFVDKKESIRIGRNFDPLDFEKILSRYYDMLREI